MPTYSAGSASLTIVPDAREFRSKLEADLRKERVDFAVQVSADLARARTDLDKFRAEQEGRAIKLRAEVDRDHMRSAIDSMRNDFEGLGKSLASALKVDVGATGISLLPSLATGLASVAQALEQVADAGVAVPGILAGIGASVGTVALALSGVKDAWSAVDKASDESGANQARQAQQAQSAINALRNAKVDELGAEKDLAQAYRDSRQQLEDLNLAVRGGALSEKEAILEAQKARRDLATGRYKDALDYQAAQLRVEEADQRVVESRQHNIELSDKVRDANAKGITNSDRVVAANERLARSHQAVQQAQASLSDVGAGGPADKAAQAMAKLAPNAREFVQTMLDLKPAFTDLRNTDAQALFAGLGQSMRTLVAADLPNLKTGIAGIAGAINGDLKQLFSSLGSDSSKGLLDRILGNTANADGRIKASIDPIVHAFGTLSAVGSNSLPRLANAFDHVADRFDKFISAAAADGRLQKWIDTGLDAFHKLGDIALHVAETFHGVSTALDGAGGKGLIGLLDGATTKLAAFVNSADGQKKLTQFFKEGRDEFHKWEPVIANIGHMLPAVFESAKQAAEEFRPIIQTITDLLAKHPALLEGVIGAYLGWKTVLAPIGEVAKAIGGVSKVVQLFIKDINGAKVATAEMATASTAASSEVGAAAAVEAGAYQKVAIAADEAAVAAGGTSRLAKAGGGALLGQVGLTALGAYLAGKELDQYQADHPGDPNNPITKQLQGTPGFKGFTQQGGVPEIKPTPPKPGEPAPPGYVGGSGGFAAGGPTPSASGPFSDGGYPAVIHPKEFVISARGRSQVPDSFLHALNKGMVDSKSLPHFDNGGPGDKIVPSPTNPTNSPLPRAITPRNKRGAEGALGPAFGAPGDATDPWQFIRGPSQPLPYFDKGGPGDGFKQFQGINDDTIPYHGHLVKKPQSAEDWGALSDFYHQQYLPSGPAINQVTPEERARLAALPKFDVGGPGDGWLHDQKGDPRDAPVNPGSIGPQGIAPNPTGAGPGILNSLIGGIASGVQGPIGNAIGLASGLMQQGAGGSGGGGGGGGGGGSMIPGVWGLAQAGASSNPQAALTQWGTQTASWLGNFAGKTLSSAADIGVQGVLGGIGLSGIQAYGQAAEKAGGFYLGDQSPFRALGGAGGVADAGDIGSQSFQVGDGSTIQIPTYGTAQGVPGMAADPDAKFGSGAASAIAYAKGHAVGQAYVYGGVGGGAAPGAPGGYDCSGIASAIYAAAKGLPQGTRYFTTESDFASLGFVPGYAPGSLNIGVMRGGGGPNSHMAVTLPNGVAVESGGSGNSTQYGGSARGAQTFPLQFHLNLPGSMPPPGGIPGLPPTLYDEGGALPVGLSMVSNQTTKPETVITHQQTQALQAVANHVSSQPTPSLPQSPDAGHMQSPQAQPQIPPALQQPQSTAAAAIPSPGGSTPEVPTPTQTGGAMSPSKAPTAVAPAPTNLDHNLKAVDTGIDSAAQAIGQGVSTAIGVAASLAGSAPFGGGASAIGAIGPYVAGAIQEGGKVVKDVVNVGSSFLVGNVTAGTQDLAYGAPLRPAQNNPNTGPLASVTNYNVSGNYELRSAMDAMELHDAQKQQAALASHPRTPGT